MTARNTIEDHIQSDQSR